MPTARVAPGPSCPHCVPPSYISVTFMYLQTLCKPPQLINPQQTDSQTDQRKKMGAGTGRRAHSLGHEHTVGIHSAAVNLKPHPNQFPLPLGISTPGLMWKSACCKATPQPATATSCLNPGDEHGFSSYFLTQQANCRGEPIREMLRQCLIKHFGSLAPFFPRSAPQAPFVSPSDITSHLLHVRLSLNALNFTSKFKH